MSHGAEKNKPKPASEPGPLLDRLGVVLGNCYHGAAPLLGAALLALTITAALWPGLHTSERYTEPVVGTDTLAGASKTDDFRAYYLLLGLVVVFLPIIGRLLRRLSGPGDDAERRQAVNRLALLGLLPALAWLAGSLIAPTGFTIPWFAASFFAGALVVIYGLSRHGGELSAETINDLGVTGLFFLFFSFVAGLALSVALARIASLAGDLASWFTVIPWITGGLGLVVTLALTWRRSVKSESLSRRLHGALLLIQAPLPLLVLTIVPPPVFESDGHSFSEGAPLLTLLALIVAAIFGYFWFRQWRRRNQPLDGKLPGVSWAGSLCPYAIGALVVFLALTPFGLPTLPSDDFHIGESFLPWHQLTHFGSIPYVDFNPGRGFTYYIYGAMNDSLYNGGMSGYQAAYLSLGALLLPLCFALTWRLAGPAAGLVVALGCSIISPHFLVLWPAILILSFPALWRERPGWWLLVWLAAAVADSLFVPTAGIAMTIGTLPLAAWCAWQALRRSWQRTVLVAGGIAAVSAVLLLVTPLGGIALGLVRFTLDNLAGYQASEGIAAPLLWRQGNVGPTWSVFGYELLRQLWIPAMAAALCLLFRENRNRGDRRLTFSGALVLMAVPTTVMMSAWTLGRIDPGGVSRPGATSELWIMALLPALVPWKTSWRQSALWAASFIVIIGLYGACPFLGSQDVQPAMARLAARPSVPTGAAVLRGSAPTGLEYSGVDFQAIGTTVATDNYYLVYAQLGAALKPLLKPGETFYDLTGHSLAYAYLDKPVPAPYPTCYYTHNAVMQERVLAALAKHQVPVFLAGPMFMGPLPSVHAYHLWRHALLKFPAVKSAPWTLLVDPQRLSAPETLGSDAQLKILDEAMFGHSLENSGTDLGALPTAWGESWSAMADNFATVSTLAAASTAREAKNGLDIFALQLPAAALAGKDADFLYLECSWRETKDRPPLQIGLQWNTRGRTWTSGLQFTVPPDAACRRSAAEGQTVTATLVVPLGSFPRWLLSPQIDSLGLQVKAQAPVSEVAIGQARLLKIHPCAGE